MRHRRLAAAVLAALLGGGHAVAARAAESPTSPAEDALRALMDEGRYEDLERAAREALARAETSDGASSLAAAEAIDWLVSARLEGGKVDEPETRALAERSLAIREQVLGSDADALGPSLDNLARVLAETAEFAAARTVFQRALALKEASPAPDDGEIAKTLNNYALMLDTSGDLQGARGALERAVVLWEKARGPDDAELASSLGNLGALLAYMGDTAAARSRLERSLAILEKVRGPDHPEVATAVSSLGELAQREGDFAKARPLLERSLEIRKRTLPADHPDITAAITNLGVLLLASGDHAGARPLLEQALERHEKAGRPNELDLAGALNNLASLREHSGEFDAARPLFVRALEILERTLGPDHPQVARSLNNLAFLLDHVGDRAAARPLFERAVAIQEKALGMDHPDVAGSLNNLGNLLTATGDYVAARAHYERALAIRLAALGPDHPLVALSRNNVGGLVYDMGDVARAREHFEQGLATLEKSLGPDHPHVATAVNNLAALRRQERDVVAARALFERSLAIREKVLGPGHPLVGDNLNSIGALLQEAGDFAGARTLHERALAIREKALGPAHPDVAASQDHLASLLHSTGDLAGARALHERALQVRQDALGPDHPHVATSLLRVAKVLSAAGEQALASELALRAETIGRAHARLNFRTLSERQALRYAAVRPSGVDIAISAALDDGAVGAAGAFDAVIRSRAFVLDEMTARRRAPLEDADIPLAEAVSAARGRLANLTFRGPGGDPPATYRKLLDDARREKERAERALADRSASFREEESRDRVGLQDVAAALGPGDALVAVQRFGRHAPASPSAPGASQSAKPEPWDAAFVLRGGSKEPTLVSLGAAAEIDALVSRWREEVAARRGDGRAAGIALREKVWDPLATTLAGIERVFVVADGALHLVSLAALPAGDGSYLLESGPPLHGLTAERDLVPDARRRHAGADVPNALLVMGNPAFDRKPVAELAASRVTRPGAAAATAFRGTRSACNDFASLRFEPLQEAEREAGEVAELWRRGSTRPVVQLVGVEASEEAFKAEASRSRVVHLATHRFFLGAGCARAPGTTRGVATPPGPGAGKAPLVGENPLLLSGLAFAGANQRDGATPGEEDGIVTAEEVASLELSGVDWVVLSACDTGRGEIAAGEGVFGLRRAFQVAGAGTVITSLWPVEDDATRRWMRALHEARQGDALDTVACVRAASLSVLRDRRAQGLDDSPVTWGAFVATGDWK